MSCTDSVSDGVGAVVAGPGDSRRLLRFRAREDRLGGVAGFAPPFGLPGGGANPVPALRGVPFGLGDVIAVGGKSTFLRVLPAVLGRSVLTGVIFSLPLSSSDSDPGLADFDADLDAGRDPGAPLDAAREPLADLDGEPNKSKKPGV